MGPSDRGKSDRGKSDPGKSDRRKSDPGLSIVLPCADDDGVEHCLASIDTHAEVVAVLNGAAPGVRAAVARPGIRVVELPHRNLGAALQAGCLAATHDLVLLMNTDAVFEPGAIGRMVATWRPDTVVRATLRFDGDSLASRVVENLQTFQSSDPDRAYQPGLLFHRAIADRIGGYFFDDRIYWTEDADFDRRLRWGGLSVAVSDGVVRHRSVSVPRKLRSAFRYGIGRAIAEERRMYGTHPPYAYSLAHAGREWATLRRRYDLPTACYGAVWGAAFGLGVTGQRHFDLYRSRRRRAAADPAPARRYTPLVDPRWEGPGG